LKSFDWVRARKCPVCGSRHYERERAYGVTRIYDEGRLTGERRALLEMGHFRCLECGFEAHY
jgi:predicted RNA-binding Zn-ribbon protein involved in translation (DUF1610 family)